MMTFMQQVLATAENLNGQRQSMDVLAVFFLLFFVFPSSNMGFFKQLIPHVATHFTVITEFIVYPLIILPLQPY